jgi:uncharacterized protein
LKALTNAKPAVADYLFTTKHPEIGTFYFEGVSAQIVDDPSVGGESFDIGLANNADCLLVVVNNLGELEEIEEFMKRSRSKRIVVVNKGDMLSEGDLRKMKARLKSKRIDGVIVSAERGYGLDELRQRLFSETGMIRVYMREPGSKKAKDKPMVLREGSTVKDVAEHILKGFSKSVKETRITGPSSKFPNQRVGLSHVMKDKDAIEFHTK